MSKNNEPEISQEDRTQGVDKVNSDKPPVARKLSLSWFPNSEIQEAVSYITTNNIDGLRQLLSAGNITPNSEIRKSYKLLDMAKDKGNTVVIELLEDWDSVPCGKLEMHPVKVVEPLHSQRKPLPTFYDQQQSVKHAAHTQEENSALFTVGSVSFNQGGLQEPELPHPSKIPVVFMTSRFITHVGAVKLIGGQGGYTYYDDE